MSNFYCKLLVALFVLVALPFGAFAEETNPQAVTGLLNRIGGEGTAERFVTVLDETLATGSEEVFVITSQDGKPCIKGSNISAITTGIGWYLNHNAHVNLAWNNLTTDLSGVSLPVPTGEEKHTCTAPYRYYLNYCTFSYSMSTWTWERWQQEIDWMALHGINMPLQIIGLDVVWFKLLTEDFGLSKEKANEFIAGPCFQAWWGMNNLQGWGGPNPDWWYDRQEQLCTKILDRERELGMEPVLPGYSGSIPKDMSGYTVLDQGGWQGFDRPGLLDPNSADFKDVAAKYYAQLKGLMGETKYYSIDPFHEGAKTDGIDVAAAYKSIYDAMNAANAQSKWVIQNWQWHGYQYNSTTIIPQGRMIVLDLYSEAHTHFDGYNGQDAVYCSLANFGGRTGLFGRFNKFIESWFGCKASYSNLKGIGAAPEAIEQVPVLYDLLFELPWHSEKPDAKTWMENYTLSRYGVNNASAKEAWDLIRNSALNCPDALQGPQEAVYCSRPGLTVNSVSAWGGTGIFYDIQKTIGAAHLLKNANLNGENYGYDLADITRQALTDYAYHLLAAIRNAHNSGDTQAFTVARDKFLQLILDVDRLLGTNENLMLGRWTQMARSISDEVNVTTDEVKDWLELNNARTIISTWGERAQAEGGSLRDYSYRAWSGMLKDYYYERWKYYFDNNLNGRDWFAWERAWALDGSKDYSNVPTGSTSEVAGELLKGYFIPLAKADGEIHYIYRYFAQEQRSIICYEANRGETLAVSATLPVGENVTATLSVDMNNDGVYSEGETADGLTIAIPESAMTGKVLARLSLSDGTSVTFEVILKDNIATDRTVSVATANPSEGSVAITGTTATSVTNKEYVEIKATPAAGYNFLNWTDADGNVVSKEAVYTYYGAADAAFTANFLIDKWGVPVLKSGEIGTIKTYDQIVKSITVTQNEMEPVEIYSTTVYPEVAADLFQTTNVVDVPIGSKLTLNWKGGDGLSYCKFSAYIDLNSDGDFEDEGEFLKVMGNSDASNNNMLRENALDILLPYTVSEGLTHIRLRFDGAWTGNWTGPEGAKPAKAESDRMIYEVPVRIVERAFTNCEIKVAVSDASLGTANANGLQTFNWVAGSTEQVVLRAEPADGYVLEGWLDSYGRYVPQAWIYGNDLRFYPVESGTYTAQFASMKTLTIDGWTLIYEDEADGSVAITEVMSGSGNLDLSAENSIAKEITRIDPQTFKNNTSLESLTLPKELKSFDRFLTTSVTGAQVENVAIAPERTIPAGQPWTLTLEGTSDGSSFNEWGSGLFATGSNAIANNYSGGFQFYLKKEGSLIVKVGGSENSFQNLGSAFTIKVEYDGANKLTVTATPQGGTPEVKTLTQQLNAISTFSTSIPVGVNITNLVIEDPRLGSHPLEGTTALRRVYVEEGNAVFSDKEGILYDAAGNVQLHIPARYGMVVDGWHLDCNYNNAGAAIITGVSSGSGSLDLSKENNVGKNVFGISETAFQNNTALTALTLPAELGELFKTSQTGAGATSASLNLNQTIPASEGFVIDAEYEYSGSGLNSWGSVMLATGTDGFDGPFTEGFQLYLQTVSNGGGHLLVKYGGESDKKLFPTPITTAEKFNVSLKYDGAGHLTAVLTRANGTQETLNLNTTLGDISALCTCIGAGTNLTNLTISNVDFNQNMVKGCTNLAEVNVEAGHAGLESRKGVVFNKSDEMLVVPEGRPFAFENGKYYRLRNRVTGDYAAASADGSGFATLSATEGAQAIGSVILLQGTGASYTAKAQDLTSAELTPVLGYISKELVEYYKFAKGDVYLAVDKEAMWQVESAENVDVKLSAVGDHTYTTLSLPFNAAVPEGYEAFVGTIEGETLVVSLISDGVVPAGVGVILEGPTADSKTAVLTLTDAAAGVSLSALKGTNATIDNAGYLVLGVANGVLGFYKTKSATIPANKAYLETAMGISGMRLDFNGTPTGIEGVENNGEASTVYDISGRRVVPRAMQKGLYIVNGKKVIK